MADTTPSAAAITLPKDFKLQSVDEKLTPKPARRAVQGVLASAAATPSLGVLSHFTGTFIGNGFNTIWRPSNGSHVFDVKVRGVSPPKPPNETILELNLTTEELAFTTKLGNVPNRGLNKQADITLSGVSYIQVVRDVTNVDTGRADGTPQDIHFEPGLWMLVPATNIDGESIVRMASIPHGTTINAQGSALPDTLPDGQINFEEKDNMANITPFTISHPDDKKDFFIALEEAGAIDTPRLPQNLKKFIDEGTINQEILRNPNIVLRDANKGKILLETISFTVSTSPPPSLPGKGDGIANIAFLEGTSVGGTSVRTDAGQEPNANATLMTAKFWITKVQHELQVPKFKRGEPPLRIRAPIPNPGAAVPVFVVNPPNDITEPRKIIVTSTQIQYSQQVNLDFSGLTWPHVSVATLVPAGDIEVPQSAFE